MIIVSLSVHIGLSTEQIQLGWRQGVLHFVSNEFQFFSPHHPPKKLREII